MFPRRKDRQRTLPQANPAATRLTHFKPKDIMLGIMSMQGSGGPSQLDAKSLKGMILNKTFHKQAQKILNSITSITNRMSSQAMTHEDVEPLMAVRMVAIKKRMAVFDPLEYQKLSED